MRLKIVAATALMLAITTAAHAGAVTNMIAAGAKIIAVTPAANERLAFTIQEGNNIKVCYFKRPAGDSESLYIDKCYKVD